MEAFSSIDDAESCHRDRRFGKLVRSCLVTAMDADAVDG